MRSDPAVLFVFAHPDDETFLTAGTMIELLRRGSKVVVCSATRGEEGEIAEGVAATREDLGAFRERELRQAMAVVGVSDVRFLDYRDSGMDGAPTNDAPEAFMHAPLDEVGARIASLIDEVRPDIIIGFGPEGVYLHPDHIAAHRGLMKAIEIATRNPEHHRPQALLFASPPREWFIELWNIEGNDFQNFSFELVQQMGVPAAELTHFVDVAAVKDQVLEALMCHATQFGTGNPFDWLPPHLEEQFVAANHYKLEPLTWNESPRLPDLFVQLP